MQRQYSWVFLFVFIDVLGFSLILPLLPFYAEEHHASSSLIGLSLTANAFAQMLSAPLIGALSDIHGRKIMLIICIMGTVASFYLLAIASSIEMIFFSRILDGLLGGNISLAQTYIADVTNESDRSRYFGFIGMAFGLGFIFGPALGGSLSVYGHRFPAYIACLISAVNLIGVMMFLPESLPENKRKKDVGHREEASVKTLYRLLFVPGLGSLLILRFNYMFTFTLWETCFGFYNKQVLSLTARSSSYLLAYVGILYSAVQGGGVRYLTRKHAASDIITASCLIFSLSLLLWASSFSLTHIILALLPLSLSAGLLNTLVNTEITKQVQQSQLGSALGVAASVASLTRVLAPITSGFLIDRFGSASPGWLGALLMLATFFVSRSRSKTVVQAS